MSADKYILRTKSQNTVDNDGTKLASMLIFFCVITLIFILCNGCTFLRYRYDLALLQVPKGSNIVDINNRYIKYKDTNNVMWVMYYNSEGTVYNVIDENQIPTKK